MSKMETNCRCR